jgi:hypothetical protein
MISGRTYALFKNILQCSTIEITMSAFGVGIKGELRKKMENYKGELTYLRKLESR